MYHYLYDHISQSNHWSSMKIMFLKATDYIKEEKCTAENGVEQGAQIRLKCMKLMLNKVSS